MKNKKGLPAKAGFAHILILIVMAVLVVGYFIVDPKITFCSAIYNNCPEGLSLTTRFTRNNPLPIDPPFYSKQVIYNNEVSDWKTYINEELGLEFQYPESWKVVEDNHETNLIRLQAVSKDSIVTGIVGAIVVMDKADSEYSTYSKMYNSSNKCPDVSGEIDYGDTVSVYCHTGKILSSSIGKWKGMVECSASGFYGLGQDPETCPHQFWINTPDLFISINLNQFDKIEKGSEEEQFFDQFLSTFKFLSPLPDEAYFRIPIPSYYYDEFTSVPDDTARAENRQIFCEINGISKPVIFPGSYYGVPTGSALSFDNVEQEMMKINWSSSSFAFAETQCSTASSAGPMRGSLDGWVRIYNNQIRVVNFILTKDNKRQIFISHIHSEQEFLNLLNEK